MLVKHAEKVIGGLSDPSKMPGRSWGLPARTTCPIGNRLATNCADSVCAHCYADDRGRYNQDVVKTAQARRLRILKSSIWLERPRENWIAAMVTLVSRQTWFRWHDSGDIGLLTDDTFGQLYLDVILEVVARTPMTHHWLPTKEKNLMFKESDRILSIGNLTPRISAAGIGRTIEAHGFPTSSVDSFVGFRCPAPDHGNECGDCRECWNRETKNIDYSQH